MTKNLLPLLLLALSLVAFQNGGQQSAPAGNDELSPESSPKDWKFGVALWTFHTYGFIGSLNMVDSAGIKYIEPNTFTKAGPEFKDSMILQLSPESFKKLRSIISKKGLQVGSVYAVGDQSIETWKKQFQIARQLGARYVTTEPPLDMWNSIDSLAGVFGIKVAIHDHWRGMSRYWSPDSVLAAIKGHKNFGACADLGHWPKSGVDPVEAVRKLSGHIFIVHLKDIAAFNDPKLLDVPVGTGVVNFPAVFAELNKQHFSGYIYVERDATDQPSNLASVIQTAKYYKAEISKLK